MVEKKLNIVEWGFGYALLSKGKVESSWGISLSISNSTIVFPVAPVVVGIKIVMPN